MRLLLFALVSGVASGFLLPIDYSFVPGVLFGLAIVAGSYARFQKVGLMRALAFVAMSTAANYAAVNAALVLESTQTFFKNEVAYGATAGLIGSVLLAIALRLVFRMKSHSIVSFALVGAAAGAVFFLLPHAALAYPLWQGAIACLIVRQWAR